MDKENGGTNKEKPSAKGSAKPFYVQYNSWIDDAYENYKKTGEMEKLKGYGKPIEVTSGDPLNDVLKNSGFLPEWIKLQHEVRDEIKKILDILESNAEQEKSDFAQEIANINKMIKKYNSLVPSPLLQKAPIFLESIKDQYDKWV